MPFKTPHPLYATWLGMKQRCYRENYIQYKDYGGRGIEVCTRWLLPFTIGFNNFVADMGERPEGHTLDRRDNDGNYTPENCRWATKKEQQRNQTNTRKVVIDGVEYIAAEIAEQVGIKTDAIVQRATYGLTMDEITNPKRRVFKEGLALGGQAAGAKKRALTHCKHGHKFTPQSTYISKEGWRRCRTCRLKP